VRFSIFHAARHDSSLRLTSISKLRRETKKEDTLSVTGGPDSLLGPFKYWVSKVSGVFVTSCHREITPVPFENSERKALLVAMSLDSTLTPEICFFYLASALSYCEKIKVSKVSGV